jgi:hypothetical protein
MVRDELHALSLRCVHRDVGHSWNVFDHSRPKIFANSQRDGEKAVRHQPYVLTTDLNTRASELLHFCSLITCH